MQLQKMFEKVHFSENGANGSKSRAWMQAEIETFFRLGGTM